MIAEIFIDNDKKIVGRTLRGEINPNQAFELVKNISLSVNQYRDYNILVDIRDTSFHPKMGDLLDIAAECSMQLEGFNQKIAFLIPNTEQQKQVARLLRTCMEIQGFEFKQFFEYDPAVEWLLDSAIGTRPITGSIQIAS